MSKGSEWAERRKKAMLERVTSKRIVYLAATGTMVEMSKRIWDQGGLTNGGKLSYNDNYELWAYKPPSPKKVTGKGKPYEDWLVRPESVSDRKKQLEKSIKRNADIYRRTGSISAEIRGEKASQKLEEFIKRFGRNERKIKGGYYKNYSAYKEQQGRANLPFELNGDLRKAWFGGAVPTPREVGPLLCTITLPEKEYKKAEGLTKSKGKFLVMTDKERAGYIRRCKELLAR